MIETQNVLGSHSALRGEFEPAGQFTMHAARPGRRPHINGQGGMGGSDRWLPWHDMAKMCELHEDSIKRLARKRDLPLRRISDIGALRGNPFSDCGDSPSC
jgi:hypothetical protein